MPSSFNSIFDKDNTIMYYALTGKDNTRIKPGRYFLADNSSQKVPYSKNCYLFTVPYMTNYLYGREVQGTYIRRIFSSKTIGNDKKKKFFTNLFGKFDTGVFNLFLERLYDGISQSHIIKQGGAAGHLNHPFEDNNLTFGDMKRMVDLVLSGKIDINANVTMKIDGQNLWITWQSERLVSARNKTQLKGFGQNGLDINGVNKLFDGRGAVQEAFVLAMKDLQKAFSSLSAKSLIQIFNNGHKWINLQIVFDKNRNVIPYDSSMLVFHGIRQIDQFGNVIGSSNQKIKSVYTTLVDINANIQKNFTIKPPAIVTVPKAKNFAKKKNYFINKITKLQNQYNLVDDNTLLDYHKAVWRHFILQESQYFNYTISDQQLAGLINRWGAKDKSYTLAKFKSSCDNQQFSKFVTTFDKQDHEKVFKQTSFDWQIIFLQLGVVVMKNLSDYLLINPTKATKTLRSQLEDVISQIQKSKDISMIKKLQRPLKRLKAIGGLNAIVPSEGIVFEYNGKSYKLTGGFADLNQILGLVKYTR